MSSIVQEEKTSSRSFVYFGVYCLGGVSLMSYIAYRGFTKAAVKMKVTRPAG